MSYKLIIFPREFNLLVKEGMIDSRYLINCDISEEKDKLQKENELMRKCVYEIERVLGMGLHTNLNERESKVYELIRFYGHKLKEKGNE